MTRERPRNVEPREALARVFEWSSAREFAGYSKHDALNSPVLRALSLDRRFLRLAWIQAVMRCPWNVRPLVGVPRARNPKGIGLFAHAYLDAADVLDRGGAGIGALSADMCREKAETLCTWLIVNASPQAGPSEELCRSFDVHGAAVGAPAETPLQGLGWGYHYPWQDVGFFQPAFFPNRVVTCWIGFAFLRAHEATGEEKYLCAAREIAVFLLRNPRILFENEDQLCLSYVPLEEIDWAVMDVSALTAAFCSRLASRSGVDTEEATVLREKARRLVGFVVDKQTEYGAWYYTWPSKASRLRHDNYHTGIILDCLADTMTCTGDHGHEEAYRRGLEYYRNTLFTREGAPRWMNDRTYPFDVHGAAAGVLAFSRAARYYAHEAAHPDGAAARDCAETAHRVLDWALTHLYSGDGYFYYRRGRLMTRRFCLMRWCNGWMSRALAQSLRFL
ncbi:MAG: hypothetical protein HQ559_12555 [Lentisphaerae bacterium]|nr:hypothetical protein [Lentisphaerota bacterium]